MPDVPFVPGVPALSSYGANPIELLLEDAVSVLLQILGVQWGIFLNGIPVLSYDNQVSFGYSQDWDISTYPVEDGSFTTYDKVQEPSEIRVRFSAGADVINRQTMLQSVDAVMSTTALYDVVTPEAIFLNYNFMHRDYDREAARVGLIVIDLYLKEVIETATASFQNTQLPSYAGQVGLGNVNAGSTDPGTAANVSSQGWQ